MPTSGTRVAVQQRSTRATLAASLLCIMSALKGSHIAATLSMEFNGATAASSASPITVPLLDLLAAAGKAIALSKLPTTCALKHSHIATVLSMDTTGELVVKGALQIMGLKSVETVAVVRPSA